MSVQVKFLAVEVQQANQHKSSTTMSAHYQAANKKYHAKHYNAMLIPHPLKKKKH
jgi:hypothetical protein